MKMFYSFMCMSMSKVNIIVIGVLLLIVTLSSCSDPYATNVYNVLEGEYEFAENKYQQVILIPATGCTGCITKAEKYFKCNQHDTTKLFIFTNIISVKNLFLRLGGRTNVVNRKNVIIDYDNVFYFPEYEEHIYPVLIDFSEPVFRIRYL